MSAHCDAGPPPAAARNSSSEPAATTEISRVQSAPQNDSTAVSAALMSAATRDSNRSPAPPSPSSRTVRSPTVMDLADAPIWLRAGVTSCAGRIRASRSASNGTAAATSSSTTNTQASSIGSRRRRGRGFLVTAGVLDRAAGAHRRHPNRHAISGGVDHHSVTDVYAGVRRGGVEGQQVTGLQISERDGLATVSQRLAGVRQRDTGLLERPHHQAGAVESAGGGATPYIG